MVHPEEENSCVRAESGSFVFIFFFEDCRPMVGALELHACGGIADLTTGTTVAS